MPTEINGVKPEFFPDRRVWAEPFFKIGVGSLPVVPDDSRFINSASFGAEIVNVERF